MEINEGRSLTETPTWAVATVISVLVGFGFFIHGCLRRLAEWLDETKRKPLLAALEKIKDELMLFGLLSLLMGHWIIFVAKICIKSSASSTRFYPCAPGDVVKGTAFLDHNVVFRAENLNTSFPSGKQNFCPEGHESFASRESLDQLHRLVFILGVTHVLYSFLALALAVIKIYSWRTWENHAKLVALQLSQDSGEASGRIARVSSFIFNHTSHPWSHHRVLVWLLCFSRQFWSSINQADYMALRLGFITTHQLPLNYDFHKYMIRSMEEEFRDIVGISVPLWIFTISCVILGFHGTDIYFWISFLPAILILLIGTKLHRVVVKLAVEITETIPQAGFHQFNLRDELFWFGKPRLLLRSIQFITFQNAFEMATYLWSLWEIKGASCFTENHSFLVIRLAFGLVSQFWCSFITFPLYVIIAQMGSKYKKSIVSENVRRSLHGWRNKARTQQENPFFPLVTTASTMSLDSMAEDSGDDPSSSSGGGFQRIEDSTSSDDLGRPSTEQTQKPNNDISPSDEKHHTCGSQSGKRAEICDCERHESDDVGR
ncbi:MLO-like protein 4 isoform X1 [Coffea arabica]|uniref:MLO-like protein n=1 Tax=Coffea arabica TaxID=13443 RepID=A0A6P6T915_COFAR|nr:MLO-like protein 4 isoform X1 [Coffea arabica]XP_027078187.1 MLO-like protein 4 isoform X1 [Coffea arabica]